MSGSDYPPPGGGPAYPPPGSPEPARAPEPAWGQPGWGQPGWGQPPGPTAPYPAPHAPIRPPGPPAPGTWLAAHKPGAVPLRPLRLGDMYDAAFKIIRFNPGATVGSAVLVASVGMLVPVALAAAATFATDLTMAGTGTATADPYSEPTVQELVATLGPTAALLVGTMLSGFGLIFVTGMVTRVTHAAALGRRMSLGEGWAATRGRRWRLVGLSLLLSMSSLLLFGLVGGGLFLLVVAGADLGLVFGLAVLAALALFPLMVFLWVRVYYLSAPPLMLEPVGVLGAIGRGWHLTRGAFWRTLGIGLLTAIIASVAGNILSLPVGLIGGIAAAAMPESRYALLLMVGAQALGSIMSTAFTAPFTAAVASLQYLDLRMRKEAYDVELLGQAGITAQ